MGGICRVGWKLFAVAVAAVLCVGMWGCTDVDYHLSESRTGAKVVGFIDDSLVMVEDYRYWHEERETFTGSFTERSGCENARLCVYNYRVQEDGPRWCDSTLGYGVNAGQLTDSVIWEGLGPLSNGEQNELLLWKVGENVKYFGLKSVFDGCSVLFKGASAKQWFDGKFIVRGEKSLNAGGDTCQYAVLDTVTRTITYKRLDENLKWIEKCDDVRAWDDDVYCLELDKETYDAKLFINECLKFIMERNQYKLGDYANVSFMGPYLKLHQTVYKYRKNEIKRMTSFSSQGISFGDGKGTNIIY